MINQPSLRRLWWKELRQLLPLALMIPMLMLLLLGIVALTSINQGNRWGQTIASFFMGLCLGMPCLFSVGFGGVAIGQEKETRTLGWLRSLPLAPATVIWVKLAAGLAILVAMWIIAIPLSLVASRGATTEMPWNDRGLATWIIYSIYILVIGAALAWYCKSAVVSLLALVPAAIVPLFTWEWARQWQPLAAFASDDRWNPWQPGTLAAFVVIAFGLQWRWGRRELGQAAASAGWPGDPSVAGDSARPWDVQAGYSLPQTATASLLWQFAKQNRSVLAGCSGMLLLASALVLVIARGAGGGGASWSAMFIDGLPVLIGALVWLATCWLGVVVFQGDANQQRIRFLADRGVSPRLTWWARHAIALPLLTVLWFVFGGALASVTVSHAGRGAADDGWLAVLLWGAAPLLAYLASQWTAQVLRTPILAAIVGPLAAVLAVSYMGFAAFLLQAPAALLVVCLLLPLVITYLAMPAWMDRRFGRGYWGIQWGGFCLFFGLPAIPLLLTWMLTPGISREVERQMSRWDRSGNVNYSPVELALGSRPVTEMILESLEQAWGDQLGDGPAPEPPTKTWDDLQAHHEQTVQALAQQLRRSGTHPVHASSWRAIEFLKSYAQLSRLSISDPTAAVAAEDLRRYRDAIALLSTIAQRMRGSVRLVEQDLADRLEIWLLAEMLQPQARQTVGGERYAKLVASLGDWQSRKQARQTAVAESWRSFDHRQSDFGGYDKDKLGLDQTYGIVGRSPAGGLRTDVRSKRMLGATVNDLWALAEADPHSDVRDSLQRIAAAWGTAPAYYGLADNPAYFRCEDASVFTCQRIDSWHGGAIASQWNAGWERQAAVLAEAASAMKADLKQDLEVSPAKD